MNINGRPKELATFIRALNDEPIYMIEPPVKLQPVVGRPTPPAHNANLSTLWLVCAVIGAAGFALLSAHGV